MNLFLWSALYILALDSKEMAVSLPVMIGVWELLQNQRRERWWLIPAVGAIITVLFIGGRMMVPAEGLMGLPNYHPAISWDVYRGHTLRYLSDIGYNCKWLTSTKITLVMSAMIAIAVLSKNAALRFGLLWMAIGVLPIAFITPQRPFAAAYLPMFGLTLFLGELVWTATWSVARRIPSITAPRWGVAAFTAVLLLMTLVHRKHGLYWRGVVPQHEAVERIAGQMRNWQPELAGGARTLILSNPFPGWTWNATFLAGILARDPASKQRFDVNALAIYQQDNLSKYFAADKKLNFELVLSMENGLLTECNETAIENMSVGELATVHCTPVDRNAALGQLLMH